MSCYCGHEYPEFYVRKDIRARKAHKCDECSCTINPGEQYEEVRAKWEGEIVTCKTCTRCIGLLAWVQAHIPCVCWNHNSLLDDLKETIDEFWTETVGLKFGFLRRLHAIEKRANDDRLKRVLAARSANELRAGSRRQPQ